MELTIGSVWDRSCDLFKKNWLLLSVLELCMMLPVFVLDVWSELSSSLQSVGSMEISFSDSAGDNESTFLLSFFSALASLLLWIVKDKIFCDYIEDGEVNINKSISHLNLKIIANYLIYCVGLVLLLGIVLFAFVFAGDFLCDYFDLGKGVFWYFLLLAIVLLAPILPFLLVRISFIQGMLKGKSTKEAIEQSYAMTKGNVLCLFFLFVMALVCHVIGFFCCCVGYFAGMAMSDLMRNVAYCQMAGGGVETAQEAEAPAVLPEKHCSINLEKKPKSGDGMI